MSYIFQIDSPSATSKFDISLLQREENKLCNHGASKFEMLIIKSGGEVSYSSRRRICFSYDQKRQKYYTVI